MLYTIRVLNKAFLLCQLPKKKITRIDKIIKYAYPLLYFPLFIIYIPFVINFSQDILIVTSYIISFGVYFIAIGRHRFIFQRHYQVVMVGILIGHGNFLAIHQLVT